MYLRITLTIFLFIFLIPNFFGQLINGKVLDDLKRPFAGVEVYLNSSKEHTHTNSNGFFELNITQENDTLLIRQTGFVQQLIPVSALTSTLTIVLEKEQYFLNEVTINARSTLQNQLANIDLTTNTKNSSQELLTLMPGLFIAQHAGGGKSEQMFLRGFDLDHGTDINISVDNVPVNMVSHAHGQGYTDLHFVIPELIESVEFGKGPFELKKGNFATAGFVDFKTKEKIDNSLFSIGYGSFNSKEIRGLFNLTENSEKQSAYIAFSLNKKDGYFESPQNFDRLNLMAKYTRNINESTKFSFNTTLFNSSWDASGQIPMRLVDSGEITRFGAVDDTEGGYTGKKTAQFELTKYLEDKSTIKASVYYANYDFELYSNFTFFERDSIDGDQIKQKEIRDTYGFNVDYKKPFSVNKKNIFLLAGVGSRIDIVPNSLLAYTKNRTILLEEVQRGRVNETNYFTYLGLDFILGDFHFNAGVRAEEIVHTYQNKLDSIPKVISQTPYAILPKASISFNPSPKLNIYTKVGQGFHSNDSRLMTENKEYLTLPLVSALDLGVDVRLAKSLSLNLAAWTMISEQEYVYVGDEGVVEPSGKTKRQGLDFSLIYTPFSFLAINSNINYTYARDFNDENGYIPLAAPLTSNTSVRVNLKNGIRASWNLRYLSDRPADEQNNAIAEGYLINDLKIGFYKEKWNISMLLLNVLDIEWNETQFLTNTRLKNELEAVEEIHFTPGTPRSILVKWTYNF